MLAACLCVLLHMGDPVAERLASSYPLGLASYVGGMAAMLDRLLHAGDDFRPRAGDQHV